MVLGWAVGRRFQKTAVFVAVLLLLAGSPSIAVENTLPDDLTDMSLEALMNIEVTSVSKKPEKQTAAAAAIYVISNADLRRWGVTTIPDALRRVPGLQVARIDANKWAITSRGFNSRFANKLLVMIDGRTVDLVSQDQLGEYGPGVEVKAALLAVIDRHAEDIGGKHVCGELDALKIKSEQTRQQMRQRRFAR